MLFSRKAFTLIEVLTTLAIIIVLGLAIYLNLNQYRTNQDVGLAVNELVAVLRNTQGRSITQDNAQTWGIHFVNSPVSGSSYSVFSGPNYASGVVEKTYSLKSTLTFTNPSASSTYDVVFGQLTGQVSNMVQIVSLASKYGNYVGDIIIQPSGLITYRLEHGMVGYFHFDEVATGTAYDASGYGNTATTTAAPQLYSDGSCKAGSCLWFNGTNNYLMIPDNPIYRPANVSVESWFNTSDLNMNTYQKIVSKSDGGGYNLALNIGSGSACNGHNICFQVWVGGAQYAAAYPTVSLPISANTWYFAAGTYDGTKVHLYLNGNEVASTTVAGGGPISYQTYTFPFCLGAEATSKNSFPAAPVSGDCVTETSGAGGWYFGYLDEVKIYDHALTAQEILNHYNDLK